MFMSVVARQSEFPVYSELAGSRVLVTGLNAAVGVDVARAFADHKCRLVIQSSEDSPEMTELAAVLAEAAADIRFFNDPSTSPDDLARLVQASAQELGGIDVVVNFVHVDPQDAALDSADDIEAFVAGKLEASALITLVAANRMRLTWTEGTILNVVTMPGSVEQRLAPFAALVRAMLADLTRAQASEWAEHGVRVNAVGPASPADGESSRTVMTSDADLAVLALHLASKGGRKISGHVLDAEGLSTRCC